MAEYMYPAISDLTRAKIREGYRTGVYHHPGHCLACPCCGKNTTRFEGNGNWWCWTCDLEFLTSDTIPVYDVVEFNKDVRVDQQLLDEL